ncbi:hypothetical protein B0H14DRAFT_302107 [Mycena olivaceomarginata]|nr:hypothetical protein B0H14DRAFT_302107 [Mycena olivaceomarginata]
MTRRAGGVSTPARAPALPCCCWWWIRVCLWLGARGRRCTCAGGTSGNDIVSPKRGAAHAHAHGRTVRIHAPPAAPAPATAGAPSACGMAHSISACTCASAGAVSAPAPAGLRRHGRQQRVRCVQRVRGCSAYGEPVGEASAGEGDGGSGWAYGGGYGDARAGEKVAENGDWGGGECRTCTALNSRPRLGRRTRRLRWARTVRSG